jgi:3-oxoacyl-[acyl-carrier protein] reductase
MTDPASTAALFDLRGRVVIVTGGAVGIGKVYAERLVEAGARVAIADVAAAESEALAARLGAGGEVVSVPTDIADAGSVERMAAAVLARFGRVDGLVNNASLMSALPRRSWLEISVEEWDRVMAVNLRGLFLSCRAVVPAMRRQGRGRIVNIASTRAFDGMPQRLHYTTSKAGVVGFTRALAREVGVDGITVNCVAPGRTLSETQLATSAPGYLKDGNDAARAIPRAQVPDDLVGAVLFLLSDASAFITGQTLVVDGGKVMH